MEEFYIRPEIEVFEMDTPGIVATSIIGIDNDTYINNPIDVK